VLPHSLTCCVPAPLVAQICGTIKWRLNNKSAKIRQQAADLISRIAPVMKACEEEGLLGHLGVVLYEYLGEEYPEVLGSILGALKGIVNVIGMSRMTPPIKELLPRLTPILKNRHEKASGRGEARTLQRGAAHAPAGQPRLPAAVPASGPAGGKLWLVRELRLSRVAIYAGPGRAGAGERDRPGGPHRGPWPRVRARARVDAHLLRPAGHAQGA
jgi:hypothetical protein